MTSLGTIWSVALAVVGVYVHRRTKEKLGGPDVGPLAALAGWLMGR